MNADMSQSEMNQLTEEVIGCALNVSNTLGCGFLEKVYENALAHEPELPEGHEPAPVSADELRQAQARSPAHRQQLLIYQRLSAFIRGFNNGSRGRRMKWNR